MFPGGDPEAPTYHILQRFWTPLGALDQRPVREQDLFREWIAAGFITGLDGPVIRTGRWRASSPGYVTIMR